MILGIVYGVIAFYGVMHNRPVNYLEHGERELRRGHKKHGTGRWYYDECFLAVCLHYVHYMVLVVFAAPSKWQVLGMHQEQGFAPDAKNLNDEDRGCEFRRSLTYPYPFTEGAFWPFRVEVLEQLGLPVPSFLPFPSVTVSKRPYVCPNGKQLWDEPYVDFNCEMARKQPWIGNAHQWYWMCGTDWDNGHSKGVLSGEAPTTHVEYVIVVWAICLVGLNLYAQCFCYPRTLYEQFVELREFPKYFKYDEPDALVAEFEARRFNDDGREEFLVRKVDAKTHRDLGESWELREELVQDAVGPVYGERGGFYGVLYDTYGKSTLDRLRTLDSLAHARDRIKLFEERAQRLPVGGISYEHGFHEAVVVEEVASVDVRRVVGVLQEEDAAANRGPSASANGVRRRGNGGTRSRSKTPSR